MSEDREADRTHRLFAGIAAVLFVHGQTTEGMRRSFGRLAGSLGRDAGVLVRWGSLTITDDGDRPSVMSSAEPTAVDIGRVVAAERLVDDLCAGRLTQGQAVEAVAGLDERPAVALARFAGMAAAGASALGIIFGAPNAITLGSIAIVAGLGACLRRVLAHASANPFLQPFAAALLAGAAGGVLPELGATGIGTSGVGHYLSIVCPCMVLVPGPHFLNGAIDLARAHIALGASRIAFATLAVLSICVGVLGGLALTGAHFPRSGGTVVVPLEYDIAAAGVAVAAYGSFFNMPWRMLPTPIAIGMLAHGTRWLLLKHGASLQFGAFVACLIVGTLMTPVAHRLRMPFGACAFAAVVSLIPGAFMFAAIAGLTTIAASEAGTTPADISGVLSDSTEAVAILLAMAAGIIVPKMLIDGILFRAPAKRLGKRRP